MRHIKKYNKFLNEGSENIWEKGFNNTKTFLYYSNDYGLGESKFYIKGCRTCNEPTPLTNMFEERQMIGNVYQSLCNCEICNNYIVYDEHNLDELEFFLKNKENILSDDIKNRKKGLNIIITTRELSVTEEPTEIVEVNDGDLDKLYVYVKQSNTNDLSDNPYNNAYQNCNYDKWKVVIDLSKKSIYSPYPWYHYQDSFPRPVKDVFNKYIKEYIK